MFLRVPSGDWPAVKRGLKREFRARSGIASQLHNVPVPSPVVAYAPVRDHYDARLMMLEAHWQEPLGAISAESLAAEGFETLAEFRRYWMARERKRFRVTRNVLVYRVRPITAEDVRASQRQLFRRLYGAFLDDDLERVSDAV